MIRFFRRKQTVIDRHRSGSMWGEISRGCPMRYKKYCLIKRHTLCRESDCVSYYWARNVTGRKK